MSSPPDRQWLVPAFSSFFFSFSFLVEMRVLGVYFGHFTCAVNGGNM